MHADRTNRVMLILLGLVLVAAGGTAMAASTGVFGSSHSRDTLLVNRVSVYFTHHGGWLWPAIAVGCLLIGLICLRWLLALLASTDRAGDIVISDGSTEGGATALRPQALIEALTSEVSAYRGVDSASGRVIGDGRDPEVVLTVVTAAAADLHALHGRIEAEALAHARHATGNPSLPVRLDLA
ncbi:MAG TPA: alkaline shock response membrane anchor protein AmaP [Trebonia sp.]